MALIEKVGEIAVLVELMRKACGTPIEIIV